MQMLWNWYTIDSCFIARSWHVRSSGAFAGSCIGVILLVISLEFLRRAQRELDRYFRRVNSSSISSHQPSAAAAAQPTGEESGSSASSGRSGKGLTAAVTGRGMVDGGRMTTVVGPLKWWQQLVRSALFMVQFAVGYFVMLLAMYYNGELFLDPFLFFFFWWHSPNSARAFFPALASGSTRSCRCGYTSARAMGPTENILGRDARCTVCPSRRRGCFRRLRMDGLLILVLSLMLTRLCLFAPLQATSSSASSLARSLALPSSSGTRTTAVLSKFSPQSDFRSFPGQSMGCADRLLKRARGPEMRDSCCN